MIEKNQIPSGVCCYHILPFDEGGRDPSLRSSKRPTSLPNATMRLLELIIARRLMAKVEPKQADSQYTYQRQRITESLFADLDEFVQDGS